MQKNFKIAFIALIVLILPINLWFYYSDVLMQKTPIDMWFWIQIVGIVLFPLFQFGMYINHPKIVGSVGVIIDLISTVLMIKIGLYGIAITYAFGIITEGYLFLTGKDGHKDQTSINSLLLRIALLLVAAISLYLYFNHGTLFNPENKLSLIITIFDLISTVLIPVAYFLQSRQSTKQFAFWVSSDFTGTVSVVLSGNIYLIISFVSYLIFDSINWVKWTVIDKKWPQDEQENQADEKFNEN